MYDNEHIHSAVNIKYLYTKKQFALEINALASIQSFNNTQTALTRLFLSWVKCFRYSYGFNEVLVMCLCFTIALVISKIS